MPRKRKSDVDRAEYYAEVFCEEDDVCSWRVRRYGYDMDTPETLAEGTDATVEGATKRGLEEVKRHRYKQGWVRVYPHLDEF